MLFQKSVAIGENLIWFFGDIDNFVMFWVRFQGDFGTAASAGRYHIVFAFFVAMMFAISLGSLFGYHCYLVINNRTTLGKIHTFSKTFFLFEIFWYHTF